MGHQALGQAEAPELGPGSGVYRVFRVSFKGIYKGSIWGLGLWGFWISEFRVYRGFRGSFKGVCRGFRGSVKGFIGGLGVP